MATNWKLWVAIAFAVAVLFLTSPFLSWTVRVGGAIFVVIVGALLVIWAIKRKRADTVEAVGLLPSLPDDAPSDMDGP